MNLFDASNYPHYFVAVSDKTREFIYVGSLW
jgi:hypothetical protein